MKSRSLLAAIGAYTLWGLLPVYGRGIGHRLPQKNQYAVKRQMTYVALRGHSITRLSVSGSWAEPEEVLPNKLQTIFSKAHQLQRRETLHQSVWGGICQKNDLDERRLAVECHR